MEAMDLHPLGSLKRKGPDDLAEEMLNVTLSPTKRFRLVGLGDPRVSGLHSTSAFSTTPEGSWNLFSELPMSASASTPSQTYMTSSPPQPSTPSAEFLRGSTPQPSEQKALVLYKPVAVPLFPGGPPAGTVDFPYKINTSLLPTPQGTDRELISHQLDCQSACSNDTEGLSGHGLFQALDLSGCRSPSLGLKRTGKVSSCSSLPRLAAEHGDQAMMEDLPTKNELAVIPWVPMTPLVPSAGGRPFVEDIDEESNDEVAAEPMEDDSVMDMADVDYPSPLISSQASVTSQTGSPVPTFSAPPWQADINQPSFNRTMWSH